VAARISSIATVFCSPSAAEIVNFPPATDAVAARAPDGAIRMQANAAAGAARRRNRCKSPVNRSPFGSS
jgi:hypothetical protein